MEDFDLYRLFKTIHVISVVLLGSGFVMEALSGALAARARTVAEVRVYARLIAFSENMLSPVAAVAIAIFGYATADRAGIDLGTTWLVLGQALFYTIAVLAIAILRPAANRLRSLADDAPDGPVTPAIAAQLRKRLTTTVGALTSVFFVFVIYLMVSKPSW